MSHLDPLSFSEVLQSLNNHHISLENLIRRSLFEPATKSSDYVNCFIEDLPCLLGWLAHNEQTREVVKAWMKEEYTQILMAQLRDLSRPKSGFHFNAGSITAEKIKDCTIRKISEGIHSHAPDVWELVGKLLTADPVVVRNREKDREHREMEREKNGGCRKRKDHSELQDEDEDEHHILNLVDRCEDEPEDIEEQLVAKHMSLLHIKQVTCISIMMQATNQRCNSLQSLVGIFLQSGNTSEQTRNFLSHLGVSVSVGTINRAMANLTKEAYREIQRLSATLLTSYAYDNLDIDLVHAIPTIETTSKDTLVHLTTASMFPLHPISTREDLNYSDFLRNLAINPPLPSTIAQLMAHLPVKYKALDDRKMSIQDRFNSWKFVADLITYGPPAFATFKHKLGAPEEIECIPLTKTKQVPLRASTTGPSTPAKNATVLEEFFRQANIGDPTNDPNSSQGSQHNTINPENTVILVFGDLLTGQHLRSLQSSRINDVTPTRRFQSQLFCPGWFHARMACADTIWRRHIEPKGSQQDPTSLMSYIMQIRPLEKNKIASNPTFRQLHEIILHVGIVLRLDAWRVAVCARHAEYSSLQEWTKSNPTWEEICEIGDHLAKTFIAPPETSSYSLKNQGQQDEAIEHTKAYHKDFLLYEETNYAMNHGDVGRLDSCLAEWMFYFMGSSKPKYANEILRYLDNMYVKFPQPLAYTIRINSLVNPTGRKDHFRGIDWVIEHNNLYIKRTFGGLGSNHTVDRMVQASPLIEVYKDVRQQFEHMFCLTHKTSRHSPPKMKLTFDKLRRYMEKNQANEFIPGRGVEHNLVDTLQTGITKLTLSVQQARQKVINERTKQQTLQSGVVRPSGNDEDIDSLEETPEDELRVEQARLDESSLFVDEDT